SRRFIEVDAEFLGQGHQPEDQALDAVEGRRIVSPHQLDGVVTDRDVVRGLRVVERDLDRGVGSDAGPLDRELKHRISRNHTISRRCLVGGLELTRICIESELAETTATRDLEPFDSGINADEAELGARTLDNDHVVEVCGLERRVQVCRQPIDRDVVLSRLVGECYRRLRLSDAGPLDRELKHRISRNDTTTKFSRRCLVNDVEYTRICAKTELVETTATRDREPFDSRINGDEAKLGPGALNDDNVAEVCGL